jgi:hypothetical protein
MPTVAAAFKFNAQWDIAGPAVEKRGHFVYTSCQVK